MGYNVHITRAKKWPESESFPITLEEWLAYVRSDKEMHLEGVATASSPAGAEIKVQAAGLAKWTDPVSGTTAWFDHWRNKISVKHPSHATLAKMFRIAVALGAHVQGDEGEVYDALGNSC